MLARILNPTPGTCTYTFVGQYCPPVLLEPRLYARCRSFRLRPNLLRSSYLRGKQRRLRGNRRVQSAPAPHRAAFYILSPLRANEVATDGYRSAASTPTICSGVIESIQCLHGELFVTAASSQSRFADRQRASARNKAQASASFLFAPGLFPSSIGEGRTVSPGLNDPADRGLPGEQLEAHRLCAFVFNSEIACHRSCADVEGVCLAGSPIGQRPELEGRAIKLRLASHDDGDAGGG
jgi:hypothetical protein